MCNHDMQYFYCARCSQDVEDCRKCHNCEEYWSLDIDDREGDDDDYYACGD